MHDDMQPNNMNQAPIGTHGEADREGAMAKADLYKLANYSLKLFKKMQDEDQLEGWVQAKITKAADYIASVYHYLEYEMEFSEYGSKLDNSEMYNEDQKAAIKNKLMEAKAKVAELKKAQVKKLNKDKKVEEGVLSGGEHACEACGGSGMVYEEPKAIPDHVKGKVEKYNRQAKAFHAASKRIDRNKNGIPDDEEFEEGFDEKSKVGDTFKTKTGVATKTDTGVMHKNTSYADDGEADDKSGKGKKSHAKAQSAAEKKDRAPAQKQSKTGTWGMKDGAKFDNRKKEKAVDETVGQGVYAEALKGKQKNLDVDGDGDIEGDDLADLRAGKKAGKDKKVSEASNEKCNHTPKGKSCPLHGMKECSMEEAAPSAGMTKKEKSATVKDAKAGKDIGKPGKSFDKVAKAAGGGEKGTKIAAAAMWKNKAKSLKENLDSLSDMPVEETAMDQMDSSLIALMQRAKEMDPTGLQTAIQGGAPALDTFLKGILSKIEAKVDSGSQPKDMAGAGDSETAENLVVVPNPSGAGSQERARELGGAMPAPAGERDPISMNESAEFTRMKEFLTRLNG